MRRLSTPTALAVVTILVGGLVARSYAYRDALSPIYLLAHIAFAAALGLAAVYRGRLNRAVLSLFAVQLVLGVGMSLQRLGLVVMSEELVAVMSGAHFLAALLILLRLE